MARKILIVGGVAGGASAATRLRRHSEDDHIVMFERGPHVSFSNCCLPYHLSGQIAESDDLVLMDPDLFAERYNIDARVNSEVVSIDRKYKTVTVKNVLTSETYTEPYNKLILSPGASPIVPRIPGIEHANVFTVRNVVDIDRLKRAAMSDPDQKIAVIGGGFIGVEVAENLRLAGHNVTLIEGTDQILRPFDYDMVQIFHKEIYDRGIDLVVGQTVTGFEKDKILLSGGESREAHMVVMAIGVRPEVELAKDAGLELGETGAILVDKNYATSDPDIYAVGDAIEVYNALCHNKMKLSLAGPALKQARAVADHINNRRVSNTGYIGSSAIKVFDYNGASTGLNESMIKSLGLSMEYGVALVILSDSVGIMPDAEPMHVKLIFEVPTGRILGAQAIGKGDVTKRIDVIASVIKFNGTIEDLKDLEHCYAPPFSTAKDIVNYVGYVAGNLLDGDFKQVMPDKVRSLVEGGAFIVDVREPYEFEHGHIKGAHNIPLSEFRNRLEEIPKTEPVYIHCRTGQRSYNAVLALQNLGFKNVYNVTGSYLGLSFYEYYNDKVSGRDSIMTAYNFD